MYWIPTKVQLNQLQNQHNRHDLSRDNTFGCLMMQNIFMTITTLVIFPITQQFGY